MQEKDNFVDSSSIYIEPSTNNIESSSFNNKDNNKDNKDNKDKEQNIANDSLSKNKVNVDIDPDTDNNKLFISFCSINLNLSCCLFHMCSSKEKN